VAVGRGPSTMRATTLIQPERRKNISWSSKVPLILISRAHAIPEEAARESHTTAGGIFQSGGPSKVKAAFTCVSLSAVGA
jgi:hypothetical protein